MKKIHLAKFLTIAYMTVAVAMSFLHIAHMFLWLGAGWQSWIMPILVDSIIIIGKISTSPEFSAKTIRAGRRAVIGGLAASLAANVTMGVVNVSAGEILAGVLVVGGALWAENHLHKLALKAVRTPAAKPAATAPKPAPKARAPRKPATPKVAAPLTHPAIPAPGSSAAYI